MTSSVVKAIQVGLAVAGCALPPTQAGVQDLGALAAPRATALDRIRERLVASPFGTIHAALFAFPRPAGADMPRPTELRLASLSFDDRDITGAIGTQALIDPRDPPRVFPTVNRAHKGDRLVPKTAAAEAPLQDAQRPTGVAEPTYTLASVTPADLPPAIDGQPELAKDSDAAAAPVPNVAPEAETAPAAAQDSAQAGAPVDASADAAAADDDVPTAEAARIYFGVESVGMLAAMQPWSPDDVSILEPSDEADAAEPPAQSGETVAAKGEVTGAGHHPKSPAERLGLAGPARAKAEKCLANAVYFEARAEPVRGQIAVAQVVMNRVFSGYYPDNVCGVVYQKANRRFACQFTFACDGRADRVDEPDAWKRAKEIARDTLDGKLWLPDVGKATHYHAYWVRPIWVREMHKLDRIGVHTFYRPRNWGDGADAPVWGDAAATTEIVKKL